MTILTQTFIIWRFKENIPRAGLNACRERNRRLNSNQTPQMIKIIFLGNPPIRAVLSPRFEDRRKACVRIPSKISITVESSFLSAADDPPRKPDGTRMFGFPFNGCWAFQAHSEIFRSKRGARVSTRPSKNAIGHRISRGELLKIPPASFRGSLSAGQASFGRRDARKPAYNGQSEPFLCANSWEGRRKAIFEV